MAASSSDVDISSMSIKALREFISSVGLSYADCLEKSDLVNRAEEAKVKRDMVPAAAVPAFKDFVNKSFAGYDCLMCSNCSGSTEVDLAVIVFHGYGATAQEFKFLSEAAHSHCAGKRIAWILPQATIGSAGAAEWWQLDAMKWFSAAQMGGEALAALIREVPPGLEECRTRLKQLVSEVQSHIGDINLDKVVLAGFSQGAMTAMDLALQHDTTVAGVVMLSGAPIVVEQWAQKVGTNHKGIKVFISHGRNDPVLPFAASGWCRDLLQNGGAEVEYNVHGGGHEVGSTTLPSLMKFLAGI